MAKAVQAQSVLAGWILGASEEGPPISGATADEASRPASDAGTVVLLEEGRIPQPSAERGPMGPQFRHDPVQRATGFADHFLECRVAFRDGGHPFFEMPSHLGARDVRTVAGEGIGKGATRRRRPHRTAGDELAAEEEVEDLMPRGLRPEIEAFRAAPVPDAPPYVAAAAPLVDRVPGLTPRPDGARTQKTALVQQKIVDSVVSHADLEALSLEDCLRYRERTADELAVGRAPLHVARVLAMSVAAAK